MFDRNPPTVLRLQQKKREKKDFQDKLNLGICEREQEASCMDSVMLR